MFNKKKNTHTWERSAIDIDEREVIKIILFTYLLIFTCKNTREFFYEDLYLGWDVETNLHLKSFGIPRTIFQHYHSSVLQYKTQKHY